MYDLLATPQMAALRELQCSIAILGQSPLRADHVGQIEIVWLDRGDAANGSKEPKVTPHRIFEPTYNRSLQIEVCLRYSRDHQP